MKIIETRPKEIGFLDRVIARTKPYLFGLYNTITSKMIMSKSNIINQNDIYLQNSDAKLKEISQYFIDKINTKL